jgi:hypothetical protein
MMHGYRVMPTSHKSNRREEIHKECYDDKLMKPYPVCKLLRELNIPVPRSLSTLPMRGVYRDKASFGENDTRMKADES